MNILQSAVLGLVEGVTEFLPISSTGHLIVVSSWLHLDQTVTNKAFEVIIQLAAILAVFFNQRDKFTLNHIELWKKIILAFIPIGVVGLLLHRQIKALFSVEIVAVMFIVGGIIFLIVEYFYQERTSTVREVDSISYKQALWIGIAQVAALIPGTSRAGSSIIGAMLVGLDRRASAEFSFLLALPVMLAASGFDFVTHYQDFSGANLEILAVGFVTAFICAYFTMKIFIDFLNRNKFVGFGIYRILFGLILLFFAT